MRRFMWSIVAIAVFATITAILAGFPFGGYGAGGLGLVARTRF